MRFGEGSHFAHGFSGYKQASYLRREEPLEFWEPEIVGQWRDGRELRENYFDPVEAGQRPAREWISDEKLGRGLERLPEAQRQVLTLRYSLTFGPAEIAELLGRSPEAVRMLEHRALRFLREWLPAARSDLGGGDAALDSV